MRVAAPLTAQKDKTAVTVRWMAHDDNGDDLMFAVWYRGVGEANWRLLKDKISEKVYSFDSALLPDGSYELKVVASDAPEHTDAEALTGERVSEVFVVDTTPPVPGVLTATMVAGTTAARRFMRRWRCGMLLRRLRMRSTRWMRGRGSIWSRWERFRIR